MSRETLLDDAIVKAKEAEDWQLVEWLRMARGGESAARWYTAKLIEARLDISNLMTENAKLRGLVRILVHCMDEVDNCDSCPINGNPYDVSKEWAACDTLHEMLCELGVEVDG